MKIISMEPTPSPNSMKLNLDVRLPDGIQYTFTQSNKQSAPEYGQKLLSIPDVSSYFQTADFIALDRLSRGSWQLILEKAREILGKSDSIKPNQLEPSAAPSTAALSSDASDSGFGEIKVLIQMFRQIPMQIRVSTGLEEKRAALPERFIKAATEAGLASPNLIQERKLVEYGIRYGELQDVLEQILNELEATYVDEQLTQLVTEATKATYQASDSPLQLSSKSTSLADLSAALENEDWHKRYAALKSLRPTMEALPLLAQALDDPHISVRRMAAVYIGDIKEPEVLPYLYKALVDRSPAVRRTAGDTLSDLGDPAAIGAMTQALKDTSKIVRWRAARFLYEVGDESAIPSLREALEDSEFEIRMQVKLALERIEGGEAAVGSVWQQMTNRDKPETEKPPAGD
ncbi:virulence factor [Paenibacillus psychroresistens]|uniref:Virulence factor n=1 Tax=Paenibacillus psychroresistens TaxID=1778678 RepID=A0A6B8RUM4_9BACL|nr:virulence factor [Paenibacillus psychroresistens]QGQ98858.1 virulence factor [Paenibacillus psychroresistens]